MAEATAWRYSGTVVFHVGQRLDCRIEVALLGRPQLAVFERTLLVDHFRLSACVDHSAFLFSAEQPSFRRGDVNGVVDCFGNPIKRGDFVCDMIVR